MGAQSSKLGNKRETLYELFDVSIDCDSDQLKRAYRQKALELHPDRNAHRIEEATALFAKIQAAYDLLQDTNERAWYDNQLKRPQYSAYSSEITSANEVRHTVNLVLKSNKLNFLEIMAYFEKLKNEEQEAAFTQQAAMPFYLMEAPTFGTLADPWSKASKFYDAWGSFSTIKDFSWEDIHPTHDIADRKTRRKLELQNKKLRDAAKKEFNCCVKQAVTQLRQLDPRKPAKQAPKNAANAKKEEQEINRKLGALQLREQYIEQEWEKPEPLEQELVECIPCEQQFETDFDLQDHNRTSAHKRTLAEFKLAMQTEDALISKPSVEKKQGKAKAKARKKKQVQQLLTCATCGQELMSEDFIEHKRITRH